MPCRSCALNPKPYALQILCSFGVDTLEALSGTCTLFVNAQEDRYSHTCLTLSLFCSAPVECDAPVDLQPCQQAETCHAFVRDSASEHGLHHNWTYAAVVCQHGKHALSYLVAR